MRREEQLFVKSIAWVVSCDVAVTERGSFCPFSRRVFLPLMLIGLIGG